MRKGFRILLVVLLLAGLGGVAWLALRGPAEPVYQGKRLSFWLQGYSPSLQNTRERWNQADAAMNDAGTKAIPTLLRMLRASEPAWKIKLYGLLQQQHLFKIDHTPANIQNTEAGRAFARLGPDARDAVPALISIYKQNISVVSQAQTAWVLGYIGPAASNAVPVLLAHACTAAPGNSTNLVILSSAIVALGQIHSQPATVVPALIELLRRHNADCENWISIALGEYGSDAKLGLPMMIKCYEAQSNTNMKAHIAAAIKKIDPEAAAKVGVK